MKDLAIMKKILMTEPPLNHLFVRWTTRMLEDQDKLHERVFYGLNIVQEMPDYVLKLYIDMLLEALKEYVFTETSKVTWKEINSKINEFMCFLQNKKFYRQLDRVKVSHNEARRRCGGDL